jgi:hypothetical protein
LYQNFVLAQARLKLELKEGYRGRCAMCRCFIKLSKMILCGAAAFTSVVLAGKFTDFEQAKFGADAV